MTSKDSFNIRPKVRQNILPPNPEANLSDGAVGPGRFPSWLHRPLPQGSLLSKTHDILKKGQLPTVCEEAKCPNLLECFSKKTATFLAMGKDCTRNCGFCDIDHLKNPPPLDPKEPEKIAEASKRLGLKHIVITMVARDDLEDGGASHLAKIIRAIKKNLPDATVEVLTSDFEGNKAALDTIIEAQPKIFNHNIETVRDWTPRVRHKATYDRTLEVLSYVKSKAPHVWVKSGIMVGLGEVDSQVEETLRDLKQAGCDIVTIGQYLQPNRKKLRVKAFITPDQFNHYTQFGQDLGIKSMYCGPFVRSSYNADLVQRKFEENH
ncbi:MAG: Lipoyl synthase [Chlamydiae bacterium]|nr:Lipoyl synthase [Chlamydiota bacterium]